MEVTCLIYCVFNLFTGVNNLVNKVLFQGTEALQECLRKKYGISA
jgi:hypothetical protein